MSFCWGKLATFIGLVILSILNTGCAKSSGSEIHLLPYEYIGPVIIIFSAPDGISLQSNEDGAVIYEIPPDGILRVNNPAPEAGIYLVTHFYVRPDGSRLEIPFNVDEETLQVFAEIVGVVYPGEGSEEIRYAGYVVGIPADRNDWFQLRANAKKKATGVSLAFETYPK